MFVPKSFNGFYYRFKIIHSLNNNNMSNQPVYWKMHNGELIDVDLMDLNHLRNVLKMIIRNHEKALQTSQANPKVKFKLNGDMAEFFNEEQDDSFLNDCYESDI